MNDQTATSRGQVSQLTTAHWILLLFVESVLFVVVISYVSRLGGLQPRMSEGHLALIRYAAIGFTILVTGIAIFGSVLVLRAWIVAGLAPAKASYWVLLALGLYGGLEVFGLLAIMVIRRTTHFTEGALMPWIKAANYGVVAALLLAYLSMPRSRTRSRKWSGPILVFAGCFAWLSMCWIWRPSDFAIDQLLWTVLIPWLVLTGTAICFSLGSFRSRTLSDPLNVVSLIAIDGFIASHWIVTAVNYYIAYVLDQCVLL